ncbi:MAG TPA: hypothetical protein VFG30_32450, partial [Polyangiales bacterium]|nr:hypothetical protein [Polyangiales bacterium]
MKASNRIGSWLTTAVVLGLVTSIVHAEDAEITALRGRLDTAQMLGKSGIAAALKGRKPTGTRSVNVDALLRAVEQGSGEARSLAWARSTTVDGEDTAQATDRTFSFDRRSSRVMLRDARGYAAASKNRASDTALIAKSRPVLEALGATSDETKIVIRSLMAQDKEGNGARAQAREIARKVMVTREIA